MSLLRDNELNKIGQYLTLMYARFICNVSRKGMLMWLFKTPELYKGLRA